MKRCINIDWLELYCLEEAALYPMNADYFERQGYYVKQREYGTRQYREMFTIYDQHQRPWIEIRRNPVSSMESTQIKGMFSPYSCHIRLSNCACYSNTAVIDLEDFLFKHRYTVSRIYRLDICLDFVKFDKGDDPQEVLSRYMRGKYAKINQSNLSAHGTDLWDGRSWNSLSWGNPKSMVSTKFYNKTMELSRPKHDKPYIRYSWWLCGLIDDYRDMTATKSDGTKYKVNVWRVEFSIKSSAKAWYVVEPNGHRNKHIKIDHTLNLYETRAQLITAFASLHQHYFRFKIHEPGKRKYKCADKVLFIFNEDETYTIDREIVKETNTTAIDTLVKRLEEYRTINPNPQIYQACQVIIDAIQRTQTGSVLVNYTREEIDLLQALLLRRIETHHENRWEEDLKWAENYLAKLKLNHY